MSYKNEILDVVIPVLGCCLLLVFLVGGPYVVKSYFEAKAYERVTGKHVTTWDAMFLQLRIEGCSGE